ncbi:MAG: carbohydrate binding domain-containing protein [Candidatus Omnitrophota bacterium]
MKNNSSIRRNIYVGVVFFFLGIINYLNAEPTWDITTGTATTFSIEGLKVIKISLPPGTNEGGVQSKKPGWPVQPNSEYAVTLRLKSPNLPSAWLFVTEINKNGDVVRPERTIRDFHEIPVEWNYATHGFFTGPDTHFVLFEVRSNTCGRNKDGMELLFADFSLTPRGAIPEIGELGKEQVLDSGFEKCPTGIFTQTKATLESPWIQHGGYLGKLLIMADGKAHDGKQYLHSESVTTGLPSGIVQEERFSLQAGSLVSISFWVRGQGEAHASIGLKNSKGEFMYSKEVVKKVDSPDEWQNIKDEFRIEDFTIVQGALCFYNFGKLDLDDYSVVVYPPKPQPLPVVE